MEKACPDRKDLVDSSKGGGRKPTAGDADGIGAVEECGRKYPSRAFMSGGID